MSWNRVFSVFFFLNFVQICSETLKMRFAGAAEAALGLLVALDADKAAALGPACVLWLSLFVFSSQTNYLAEEMVCRVVSLPRYL